MDTTILEPLALANVPFNYILREVWCGRGCTIVNVQYYRNKDMYIEKSMQYHGIGIVMADELPCIGDVPWATKNKIKIKDVFT